MTDGRHALYWESWGENDEKIFLHLCFIFFPWNEREGIPFEEQVLLQWLNVSRLYLQSLVLMKVKHSDNHLSNGPENQLWQPSARCCLCPRWGVNYSFHMIAFILPLPLPSYFWLIRESRACSSVVLVCGWKPERSAKHPYFSCPSQLVSQSQQNKGGVTPSGDTQ